MNVFVILIFVFLFFGGVGLIVFVWILKLN